MTRFLAVWFGQVVAGIGSSVATFCLGIWLYRASESVTQFSLLLFFNVIPVVLLAGVAGSVADRVNQRRTMIIADSLNAVVALGYFVMFRSENAQPLGVYTLALVAGGLNAFQWPAYRSWSTKMVPPRDYGRVGGLMKLGEGIPFLLGPVLGGALMTQFPLSVVFVFSLVGFAVAVAVLFAVGGKGAGEQREEQTAQRGTSAWTPVKAFLRTQRGLVGLLLMSPLIVFTEGWVVALFQPYMLHHVTSERMGLMLSLGGMGMVVGGIVMGVWGGPKRRILCVMAAVSTQTLAIGVLALAKPTFFLGTTIAFVYFCSIPFLSGANQAIWTTHTPEHLQGRMFAFRRATESIATPASLLTAGVLVDYVLTPLLSGGGALHFVHTVVPAGPSQGMAVLFLVVVGLNALTLTAAGVYRPVWNLDSQRDPESRREAVAACADVEPSGRPA